MTGPKFVPKPGQVDYTNIRYAPVIQCVLKHNDNVLLLKRSQDLRIYPGYWSGVAGFLDDAKDVEVKVYEELKEELGLKRKNVISIKHGNLLSHEAKEYVKTFLILPFLIEVDTDNINLDWETSEYKWLAPEDAKKMNLMPGFDKVFRAFYP